MDAAAQHALAAGVAVAAMFVTCSIVKMKVAAKKRTDSGMALRQPLPKTRRKGLQRWLLAVVASAVELLVLLLAAAPPEALTEGSPGTFKGLLLLLKDLKGC